MESSYHIIRIQRYLSGELSKEEMYQLERDALDDPFLQDALDGYREANTVDHGTLSLLQQRLATRVAGQQEKRNSFFFGVQRLAIGATAFVLFVTVCILFWMRTQVGTEAPATEVEVELQAVGELARVSAQPHASAGSDASPVDGWNVYQEYLSVNSRAGDYSGTVVLEFDVDASGKPTGIVRQGPAISMMAEAERLLVEGPRWNGKRGIVVFTFQK